MKVCLDHSLCCQRRWVFWYSLRFCVNTFPQHMQGYSYNAKRDRCKDALSLKQTNWLIATFFLHRRSNIDTFQASARMFAQLGQFTVCRCIIIERSRGAVSSVLNQYFIYNERVKIILDVLRVSMFRKERIRVVILQITVANNHNILFIDTNTSVCDNK